MKMKLNGRKTISYLSEIIFKDSAKLGDRLTLLSEFWPLTKVGHMVAITACLGMWFYAFKQHDLVWYVGSLSALVLILVSILSAVVGALLLSKYVRQTGSLEPHKCVTHIARRSGFALPRMPYLPLLEIKLIWTEPDSTSIEVRREENQLMEWFIASEHGDFTSVVRRFSIGDVLGLTSISLRYPTVVNLAIMPNRGAYGRVPWLASINSGEDLPHPLGAAVGDRIDLRRYNAGDPARFIHWKAYARTGKLMQREPETSRSRKHRTAAYLVSGPADGASAAAAMMVLEVNALGVNWVFAADGTTELLESQAEVGAAIRRSASHRNNGGEGLATFMQNVGASGSFNLMLFVPSIEGDWTARVISALGQMQVDCTYIIGVDGLQHQVEHSFWRRCWKKYILRPEPDSGCNVERLKVLVDRLEGAAGEVLIADRSTGQTFNRKQLHYRGSTSDSQNKFVSRSAGDAV